MSRSTREPIFTPVIILLMGIGITGVDGVMISSLAGWYAARWFVLLTWAVCLPCFCKALYDQRKSRSAQNDATPARFRPRLAFRMRVRQLSLHLTPEQKIARRMNVGFWALMIETGATYLSWNDISHAVALYVATGFAVLLIIWCFWVIRDIRRLGKEQAKKVLTGANPLEHFLEHPEWPDQLLNDVEAWHAQLSGTADAGETEQSEGSNPDDV